MASDGLLDRVVMAVKLVANGCPDKVRTIGIEPLLHEEIDMTEVDVAEVDGDLLAIGRLRSKLTYVASHQFHPLSICMDGIWRRLIQLQAAKATFDAGCCDCQHGFQTGTAPTRQRRRSAQSPGSRMR